MIMKIIEKYEFQVTSLKPRLDFNFCVISGFYPLLDDRLINIVKLV